MTTSPYLAGSEKRQFVVASSGAPIAEALRRPGSSELMIGRDGDLNAGSRKELMQTISTLIDQHQKGVIVQRSMKSSQELRQEKLEKAQAMSVALADRSGREMLALGEVVGDQIWETLGREGFARKTMIVQPLNNGEVGRLRVRQKDVTSFMSTTNINVTTSQIRQEYVYPGEFYLLADVRIENKELAQSPGDLLDDKYQDGLEQIMVAEDRVWKRLADRAAPSRNRNFSFTTFTPTVCSTMHNEVFSHGIPVANILMAFDIWPDVTADTEFSSWFSEIAKHELIMQGQLGSIMGANIITDAFRHDNLKVLERGEIYFCGEPVAFGGITQRQELDVRPVDGANYSRPERGWFFNAIEGMAIVNNRAITKGKRLA